MSFQYGTDLYGRKIALQLGESLFSSDDFRIDFSINKSIVGKPNSSKISIYNLDRISTSLVLASNRDLFVRVFAGYGEDPYSIFVGNPVKNGVSVEYTSGDRIINIEARDCIRKYQTKHVDLSFATKTTFEEALFQVASSMDLAFGIMEVPQIIFSQGLHLSGRSSDLMDRLASMANSDWSIQDGVIQFIPRDKYRKATAYLFSSSDRTLLESPKPRDKGGVQIKGLLNASIKPGDRFVVDSDSGFMDGDYKAIKVTHSGSTWTNEWFTNIEGKVTRLTVPATSNVKKKPKTRAFKGADADFN